MIDIWVIFPGTSNHSSPWAHLRLADRMSRDSGGGRRRPLHYQSRKPAEASIKGPGLRLSMVHSKGLPAWPVVCGVRET